MCMKVFLLLFRFYLINLFLVFQVFRNLFLANQKVITFDLFFCVLLFSYALLPVLLFEGVFCCFSFIFINLFWFFRSFVDLLLGEEKVITFKCFLVSSSSSICIHVCVVV